MRSYDKVEVLNVVYDRFFDRHSNLLWFNKREHILFHGRVEGAVCTLCFGALVYGGIALIKKVTN